MPKYLALTIGPIVKTLLRARKTRELWTCSYLLSSLMSRISAELDQEGKHILIPQIPADLKSKPLYGAGIYPDRLFMLADHLFEHPQIAELPVEKQEEGVHTYVAAKVKAAHRSLAKDCLLPEEVEDEIEDATVYWGNFFRVRWIIQPLDDIEEGKLSRALSPYLECLELEDVGFPKEAKNNYLSKLFEPDRLFHCSLIDALKEGKGRYDGVMRGVSVFPSTSELGAFELYQYYPEEMKSLKWDAVRDPHEVFYERLSDHESLRFMVKPYHKYFCIVQADGDGIGEAIKQLNTAKDYTGFSEKLAQYGVAAADIINTFGGKPVYIGGDDLLFLCPLRTDKGTVFDLMADLDQAFERSMDVKVKVSLSYGLNVVYYKYPLFEAIAETYDLLKKAKNNQTAEGAKKNSISFQFTKHSGSAFAGTFSKAYLMELNKALQGLADETGPNRDAMVSSLVYKLKTLEQLFLDLITSIDNADEREQRLKATLEHYFAEWKDVPWFKAQRKAIRKLLLAAIVERGKTAVEGKQHALNLFYASLRLLRFISLNSKNKVQHDTENIAQTAG